MLKFGCAASVVLSLAFAPSAWAGFPKYETNPKVAALEDAVSQDPAVASTTFLVDSEKPNLVYMLPPPIQSQAGGSMITNMPMCLALKRDYLTTYQMPTDDPSEFADHVDDPYVSAFFAKSYVNTALRINFERNYREKINKLDQLAKDHQQELEDYERVKYQIQEVDKEIEAIEREIRQLRQAKNDALANITGTTVEERSKARDEAYERCDKLDDQIDLALAKADKLRDQRVDLRYDYSDAYSKWMPYERQYDDLKRSTDLGRESLALSTQIAKTSFDDSLKSLNRSAATGVAFASASYNVFGDALGRVRQAKSQNYLASGLDVEAMPLSNVSTSILIGGFNHGIQVSGPNVRDATSHMVQSVDLENAQPIGYPPQAVPSLFKDEHGKPLPILQRAFDLGLSTGTFNTAVTRGAYCTGKTEMDVELHHAQYEGHPLNFESPKYQSRERNNALYQTVALNYEYLVEGEPAEVSCEADIKSVINLFRDAGESRNFFTTRKWDKSTRNTVRNSGIKCTVKPGPDDTTVDPGALRERLAKREEDYSKAIVQEVLNTFGINLTWTAEMPASPELGQNPLDAKMNMPGICQNSFLGIPLGGRHHCQLTDVATKSIQALFGAASQASATKDARFEGKVKRSYSESTYRRLRGATAIELKVAMPE